MFRREKKNNWALINRVKYDGPCDGSPWLIYKYPEEDFVYGSQLVVNQGQEALFLRAERHWIYSDRERIRLTQGICHF